MPLLDVNTHAPSENVESTQRSPVSQSFDVPMDLDVDQLCREISLLIGRVVTPPLGITYDGALAVADNITLKEYVEIIDNGMCEYHLELRDGVLAALQYETDIHGMFSSTTTTYIGYERLGNLKGISQEDFFFSLNSGFIDVGVNPDTGKPSTKVLDGGVLARGRHFGGEGSRSSIAIKIANFESVDKLKQDMKQLLGPSSGVMIFIGINLFNAKYGDQADNKFKIFYGEREVSSPVNSDLVLRRRREFEREFDFDQLEELQQCLPQHKDDFPLWPVVRFSRFHLFNGVRSKEMPPKNVVYNFDICVLIEKLQLAWNDHRSKCDSFWSGEGFDLVDVPDSPTEVQFWQNTNLTS